MTDIPTIRDSLIAWLAQVASALIVVMALSACDTADYTVDWFDDDDEQEATAEGEDGGAGAEGGGVQQPVDRPFPNLSTVPERPGPPEIQLEAVSMQQGLSADKENARYTDQALRSQTANIRARPRPAATPKTAAEASTGPTAADLAARPSPPPPPPPGTPAAERAAQARAAEAQAAQAQPARPQPIGKQETQAAKPALDARQAPAPEPVKRDSTPKRARPAPPPVAAVTAPTGETPAQQPPVQQRVAPQQPPAAQQPPVQQRVASQQPPAAQQPAPVRPGTTTLIATIYFAEGQTELTPEDLGVLRQVIDIQGQGGGNLRVVGHSSMTSGISDPTRRRLVNFKVSLDRATIVARNFQELGLAPDRIAVEAMGDSQPIYSEETAAGVAGNRRAEIFLGY